MTDESKAEEQLIAEPVELRERIAQLEASVLEAKRAEALRAAQEELLGKEKPGTLTEEEFVEGPPFCAVRIQDLDQGRRHQVDHVDRRLPRV
ncbi:MAG: hypothetical protein CEE40_08375 [Chloroflexi bacterium B3_Chlor]|nr:MAG: hypothetical protein CEE40_08375 [Chloroflexi bacterium B3_Chlor]